MTDLVIVKGLDEEYAVCADDAEEEVNHRLVYQNKAKFFKLCITFKSFKSIWRKFFWGV